MDKVASEETDEKIEDSQSDNEEASMTEIISLPVEAQEEADFDEEEADETLMAAEFVGEILEDSMKLVDEDLKEVEGDQSAKAPENTDEVIESDGPIDTAEEAEEAEVTEPVLDALTTDKEIDISQEEKESPIMTEVSAPTNDLPTVIDEETLVK